MGSVDHQNSNVWPGATGKQIRAGTKGSLERAFLEKKRTVTRLSAAVFRMNRAIRCKSDPRYCACSACLPVETACATSRLAGTLRTPAQRSWGWAKGAVSTMSGGTPYQRSMALPLVRLLPSLKRVEMIV